MKGKKYLKKLSKMFYKKNVETIKQLQKRLEEESLQLNGGQCDTYNICKYCKENNSKVTGRYFNLFNFSQLVKTEYVCANAYLEMKKQTGKELLEINDRYKNQ